MIRIRKLTDYGIVLLTHLARQDAATLTARDLSRAVRLPLPTVGKLLKALSQGSLLTSVRGAAGGYRLAKPAESITVAEMISLLEGPIAITECAALDQCCGIEKTCPSKSHLQRINQIISRSLGQVTLADLMRSPGT